MPARAALRRGAATFLALLALAFVLVAGSAAGEVEVFVLWGLDGRWDGHIEVTGGHLLEAAPYSFEEQYGDRWLGNDGQKAGWESGVGGQFDGVRLRLDGDDRTVLLLVTPGRETRLTLRDFPADGENRLVLEGDRRFVLLGRGDPAAGPKGMAGEFELPPIWHPPVPDSPLHLPDGWWREEGTALVLRLPRPPSGEVRLRRVSRSGVRSDGDGRLYLEVFREGGPLCGEVSASFGARDLGRRWVDGSVWLALEPRYGRLPVRIEWTGADGAAAGITCAPPACLVETRGTQLYLNGEPFLVKGTYPRDLNDADARDLKDLGANALRTHPGCSQVSTHGFMTIKVIHRGPGHLCAKPMAREVFLEQLERYLDTVRSLAVEGLDEPDTLLAQLGNEQARGQDPWLGRFPFDGFGRLDYLLACAYNVAKPICPMVPCGYSNNILGYRTPAFLEVYEHNTFLDRDRGNAWPPIETYMEWQGTHPGNGYRPWIMSEWGANVYMPEAYRFGPIFPVLEKIHAWNYPNRWREYLGAGVRGGTSYCLYDYSLEAARRMVGGEWDQGFRQFGVMTFERQPKLALWELWHLWRDFEAAPVPGDASALSLTYRRDYWARTCRLRVTRTDGAAAEIAIEDFPPDSRRIIRLPDLPSVANGDAGWRWRLDYRTHGGLPMAATGAWPERLEREDFLERLRERDTVGFLRQLLEADVLRADGRADVTTLAEMTREDGVTPVLFRVSDGIFYLTVFHRRRPGEGLYHHGISVEVAVHGDATRVDPLTGFPSGDPVDVEETPAGLRLKDLRVPFWPAGYTSRSAEPMEFPLYRITPR
ncbi:MAG: hypothetical protein JXR77_11895 [Lentisphaeria bacterium]|nr:hypothetical protein [Lentisphaeria bacterium]